MSNATTKPPRVLPLDWKTHDPHLAMLMGKNLASRGHVVWRPTLREWKVIDPTLDGVYWTVQIGPNTPPENTPWTRLTCTCLRMEHRSDPCVHKAAVHHHASQTCEYSYYLYGE